MKNIYGALLGAALLLGAACGAVDTDRDNPSKRHEQQLAGGETGSLDGGASSFVDGGSGMDDYGWLIDRAVGYAALDDGRNVVFGSDGRMDAHVVPLEVLEWVKKIPERSPLPGPVWVLDYTGIIQSAAFLDPNDPNLVYSVNGDSTRVPDSVAGFIANELAKRPSPCAGLDAITCSTIPVCEAVFGGSCQTCTDFVFKECRQRQPDGCLGLDEATCKQNPRCAPVYGGSCPVCTDTRFFRCKAL